MLYQFGQKVIYATLQIEDRLLSAQQTISRQICIGSRENFVVHATTFASEGILIYNCTGERTNDDIVLVTMDSTQYLMLARALLDDAISSCYLYRYRVRTSSTTTRCVLVYRDLKINTLLLLELVNRVIESKSFDLDATLDFL